MTRIKKLLVALALGSDYRERDIYPLFWFNPTEPMNSKSIRPAHSISA
jgi:hypothetical protein